MSFDLPDVFTNLFETNNDERMKNKIVVWGTNAADEKILIGLELLVKQNKVLLHTFPATAITDAFEKDMMDNWRTDKGEVSFPEGHQQVERELSITDNLLPDEIKTERTDIIQRAQTEWHFVVLSSKLSDAYRSELRELEERIAGLKEYNKEVWENLKGFWGKVQTQLRDRTLLREHGDELRERSNQAFTELKELRGKMDQEFKQRSNENLEKFNAMLGDIETKISENKQFKAVFEELKGVQKQLRDYDFTREHRNKLWQKVDKLFKDVKEKRFGDRGSSSPLDRTQSRLKGLKEAIEKMERSIKRDEDDLEFQRKRIKNTDGQLEAQIREAKIQMIEQRVGSKRVKLNEMLTTRTNLEARLEKEKERQAKQAPKTETPAATETTAEAPTTDAPANEEAVAETPKEDASTEEAAPVSEATTEEGDTTTTTEEEPKESASLLSAIGTTIGESLEDMADTVKAVAQVVGDQIEQKVEEIKEEFSSEEEE